jgi:hypothetical protein
VILEAVTTSRTLGWAPTEVDGINLLQRNGLFEAGTPVQAHVDRRFTKVVGFWAPRRWLTPETMDIDGMVAEIEEIVGTRGLVAYDGQVITSLRRVGPWEACFEAVSIETPLDIPKRRPWGPEQRAFFGVGNPYQIADDDGPFTWSSISTVIADPYLAPGELIAGVIHGANERCFYTCPCHYTDVVYTTRHRLVCMSCGATHIVLKEPVLTSFRQTISPEEWDDLFGATGSRHHEPVELAIVDVQDIENGAPFVWSTNQWDEALDDYILHARATPEEFEKVIRGAEADASILLEAGFTPDPMPPAPAIQITSGSFDVDMMDSAGHALAGGASAYLAAYVHPERLIDAVKDLFQAIELLLKVRLEASKPLGLRDQPNNPTVLVRLAAIGVALSADETNTLTELRRLRNDLQHSSASFNQRAALSLCRRALILIDRFVVEELNAWPGDVIAAADWHQLLAIEEISAHAISVVQTRLAKYRDDPEANISACPQCGHEAMLRPHPNTGASCLICGHVPVSET